MKHENELATQENFFGAPRCKECNKLFKKSEANEYELCPTCLSKLTEPEGQNTEIQDIVRFNRVESEQKQANNVVVRAGQAIRDRFFMLISDGKITDEIIAVLVDKEGTAKLLGIRYAFLKVFNANVPIKELTYINGSARYSAKPVEINGKQYLITNDLYTKNLLRFMEWAKEISK